MEESNKTHFLKIETYEDLIYQCSKCGSQDIKLPVFYSPLTKEIEEINMIDICAEFCVTNECYCMGCDKHGRYDVKPKTTVSEQPKIHIDKFNEYEGKVI